MFILISPKNCKNLITGKSVISKYKLIPLKICSFFFFFVSQLFFKTRSTYKNLWIQLIKKIRRTGSHSWISQQSIFLNFIRNYTKDDKAAVKEFSIQSRSKLGESFASDLLRASINYTTVESEAESISVIVKVMPLTVGVGVNIDRERLFMTEMKMYGDTLIDINRLLLNINNTVKLFPRWMKLNDVRDAFSSELWALKLTLSHIHRAFPLVNVNKTLFVTLVFCLPHINLFTQLTWCVFRGISLYRVVLHHHQTP